MIVATFVFGIVLGFLTSGLDAGRSCPSCGTRDMKYDRPCANCGTTWVSK